MVCGSKMFAYSSHEKAIAKIFVEFVSNKDIFWSPKLVIRRILTVSWSITFVALFRSGMAFREINISDTFTNKIIPALVKSFISLPSTS